MGATESTSQRLPTPGERTTPVVLILCRTSAKSGDASNKSSMWKKFVLDGMKCC